MTLDQFEPGTRVYIKSNVAGDKLFGTVATGWSGGGSSLMVKFDDDRMVEVNKANAMFFHLDMRN